MQTFMEQLAPSPCRAAGAAQEEGTSIRVLGSGIDGMAGRRFVSHDSWTSGRASVRVPLAGDAFTLLFAVGLIGSGSSILRWLPDRSVSTIQPVGSWTVRS